MALTPRQQEIKGLLDKNMTPAEIASVLGITDNAVYQQLRRMSGGNGRQRLRRQKEAGEAAAKPRRKPGRKPKTAAPSPPPAMMVDPTVGMTMTPLQSVRARREQLEAELQAGHEAVEDAMHVLTAMQEQADDLVAKHSDELQRLSAAEIALCTASPEATPPAPAMNITTEQIEG